MASNPQGVYARLKTEMKDAYYTDKMVQNLENFRTMASTYLSGPGEYEDLPFLKICANLEGNGTISWKKLDKLKEIVASARTGKMQILEMIDEAERKIQESSSDSGCSVGRESGAQQLKVKDEDMVVNMERYAFRVTETHAAFLECCVDPKPKQVVWKKGETTKVDNRIIINNKKYFGASPASPTLVIKETEKIDEAYYQCTAKDIGIEVTGKAVQLKVDTAEERGSNIHGEPRSHSSAASGTRESHIDINSKLSPRSQDKHIEPRSWSPEDMHQEEQSNKDAAEEEEESNMHGEPRSHSSAALGTRESHIDRNSKLNPRLQDKHFEPRSWSPEEMHQEEQSNKGLAIQILMSTCQMMFTISNYNDVARLSSFIKGAFYAATGENNRIEKLDFEKKCIQVHMEIKAANSLSEAPAICLAEQFKHYILDVGLQLSEGSKDILKVDEASIKITAEHMPEDGLPLVNICPQQGSVQHSKSVILQTYIVSSPRASSIEWFRIEADNVKSAIEINSKKYYGATELSPSLIVRDLNADDEGWYMCLATNNNGTGCSNKTFVRISSESAREEDEKLGTIVTDVSDIKESARAEDTSETSDFDIKDRQEPARGAEDTSQTSVFDIKDRQDPPNTPRAMQVTSADRTAMTISWKPPFENYGSPVTEYIVEKQADWIQVSTVPANKLYCVADNLIEGTKYRFRVTPFNQYGKGRALESDQTYMAKSPYDGLDIMTEHHRRHHRRHLEHHRRHHEYLGRLEHHLNQPRDMQVTNADKTAMFISWQPPFESVSPVTEYIVEKQTDWIQVSKANKLSCVADDLIEGTKYRFRVIAVNKYGKGMALESDQTYTVMTPYDSLQTRDSPESTEREISDIKDLVASDVWDRVPSKTEIKKIVTLIDSKFSDLFVELGLPLKTVEEYGQGQPVTFQVRMKALLRYWIDSFQTKATIGSLLTAMKLCQMDWHTAAQIWSAK